MEQMSIIITCLINIMDTGNKIIIIVEDKNKKMYPFDDTLTCLLPVGNTNPLKLMIETIKKFCDTKIWVVSKENGEIREICDIYKAEFIRKDVDFLTQIHNLIKTSAIILRAETILDEGVYIELIKALENNVNCVVCKNFDGTIDSRDTMAALVQNNVVVSIYAHPRVHYVNSQVLGAFVINEKINKLLPYVISGFHNVNCGQMPDESFYLEEVIQRAIENNVTVYSIGTLQSIEISFAWQLAQANEMYASKLSLMTQDDIHISSCVSSDCFQNGYIRIGRNCKIGPHVIIEGNCWIGDNVVIEKGAIIGKNTIINSNTHIYYNSLIHDYCVIGSNNKIGYNAEVSGITFDGVCAVHGCEIYGIIGKKVDIAANVQMAILRFDDSWVSKKIAGKRYSNQYTNLICIGNYCRTGVGNIFLPGVYVGTKSCIGPGVLVDKDIASNTLVLKKQELIETDWGSEKYGW